MTIYGRIGLVLLLLGSVTYGGLRHALHLWPWTPVVASTRPQVRPTPPTPLSIGQFLVFPHVPTARVTYLIAGVTPEYSGYHQRAPEAFKGLTDSMLLMQLDPLKNVVHALSLPRDTRVTLEDQKVHKLNAALPLLGPDGLVRTVSTLTGLDVRGYLLINLDAVRELTDAVGGVRVFMPEDMDYDDTAANLHIHLKRGDQVLQGGDAEAFIRFRHDALVDIGRTQRQQTYLKALAKVLLSPAVLTHLPAISAVLNRDTRMNLTSTDVSGAIGMMLKRPTVEAALLPGAFLTEQGISYWKLNPAGVRTVLANFGGGVTPPPQSPVERGTVSVALVDAGAPPGALAQLRVTLLKRGYRQVVVSSQLAAPVDHTEVLSNTALPQAAAVQQDLHLSAPPLVSGEGVLWADVSVRAGPDALAPSKVLPATLDVPPSPPPTW